MTANSVRLTLRFPREQTVAQGFAALLALNGLSTPHRRNVLVLEARGTALGVELYLQVPDERSAAIRRQLQTAIPGLEATPFPGGQLTVTRAWQAWQSTGKRSLASDQPEATSAGLLAALSAVAHDELLVLQWLLGPVRRPLAVGNQVKGDHGQHLAVALVKAPVVPLQDLDSEARQALRAKQGLPGWRACLRIGVKADGLRRQRQLLGQLAAAIRVAQGPSVQLGFDGCRPSLVQDPRRPLRWPLVINVGELLGLTAWPLGETAHLPVDRVRSRTLSPSRRSASHGHIVGTTTFPGQERPVAIGVKDALSHSHLIGVTGSGKSTVILNWIIQDLQAGRALLLVEPKGDLVRDVLARVPDHRVSDIVVIDPADIAPVGLNPLAHRGIASEVTVDLILAIFKGLFGDAIGPRTQDLLTAGIMTLATQSNLSLVALPRLFTDSHFRARLVQGIEDRLALDPFFAWYDNLSATEQSSVLAPLMNKLRVLLLRPSLRRVIGQPTPRFDLRQVFTEHRVVLVNAATGTLGGEAASLLGSIVVSLFWQATLERNRIAPERRHPVFLYVDEVQQYLHLPTDLADVLATARSMGVGLVAAHQSLSQLTSSSMRAALLANARSRLVMTTSHDDAVVLTKGDRRLDPEDVTSLGRFEAYASLLSRNEPQPYTSIRTLPAPPAIRDPEEVRDRSRRAWGIPAGEIDAALDDMVGNDPRRPSSGQVVTDLGVRRRRPKGPGGSP